jgi:hypothetical protein
MYKLSDFIDSHMGVSIISSVGIIMAFLGIFFFTYASKVEQEIVEINTNVVVNDLLDTIIPLLNEKTKANLLENIKHPNMEDADKQVAENNKNIMFDSILKLSIIFIILSIIAYAISYYTHINYINIIGLNLIILIFIGLTEYTFLHMIVKKFIAADTNYVRYLLISNLGEKLGII